MPPPPPPLSKTYTTHHGLESPEQSGPHLPLYCSLPHISSHALLPAAPQIHQSPCSKAPQDLCICCCPYLRGSGPSLSDNSFLTSQATAPGLSPLKRPSVSTLRTVTHPLRIPAEMTPFNLRADIPVTTSPPICPHRLKLRKDLSTSLPPVSHIRPRWLTRPGTEGCQQMSANRHSNGGDAGGVPLEAHRSRPTTRHRAWKQCRSMTAPAGAGGSGGRIPASFPTEHPRGSPSWNSLALGCSCVLSLLSAKYNEVQQEGLPHR